ncbi:MAG: serine--tRNA ligase [Gammaproteobacteria bacterium RIFCSPHIGHO2_12_FULL_42_13]|nr:MAG: serine--tRNA ligase [Gammaproteobacteria bacterium RIFCSPHIGHO2_12_FULL_42_13]
MLDPKLLRQDPAKVADEAKRHGVVIDINHFSTLETQRKKIQDQTQELQAKRNQLAKQVGMAKSKGDDASALLKESAGIGDTLKQYESQLETLQQQLNDFQSRIPNKLHDSVPDGKSEADNIEIRKWGTPRKFLFTPKDHVDLGAMNNDMDFEAASRISGARFVVLKNKLARLQRALAEFMMDVHTEQHGYTELYIPYLVHSQTLYGTGQLPKFADDFFAIKGEHELMLIPTSEAVMASMTREQIVEANQLPLKFVTHSPCFRSEAGSYGKDTRGMIRQHQFQKVELVQITTPEKSYETLEEITRHAERILQLLELPYRVMLLCSGDTGFGSAKTYDLEVWLPSQNKYREISSCSNCEDFQARRMMARYRAPSGKPELVHTLNGSALAVGRTLVAIMENYQDEKGDIEIPKVLLPYL